MRCGKCGSETGEGWKFCPRCGSVLEKAKGRDLFEDVFERMEHEMKEMDRAFRPSERNFEVIDISPFFKQAKGSGFTVKITRSGDGKPKIDIKTFGDVDKKELENEVNKLGFRDRIGRALKPAKVGLERREGSVRLEDARTTEEPETSVKNIGGRIIAEVSLPGVKKSEDIEIRVLENSVEVRALAGNKAYFKILTKPPQTSVVRREFGKGVLTIELG
jgi:HSP20 family molecular chaperone IbpA